MGERYSRKVVGDKAQVNKVFTICREFARTRPHPGPRALANDEPV